MRRTHFSTTVIHIVVDSALLEVRVEAGLQILGAYTGDLKIKHKEWLIRDRNGAAALDMQLCLQYATKDIPDQAWLKDAVLVFLDGGWAQGSGILPLILSADVLLSYFLVYLRDINFL